MKIQNPGWDLAMAVDWETRLMAAQMAADRVLEAGVDPAEPEKEETPESAPSEPEVVKFGSGAENDAPQADAKEGGIKFVWVGVVAALVGLVAAVTMGVRKGH